jgi:predicted GNAT family acetyltransferase
VYDIGLHVDQTNTPARRLYDAVGFQKTGELDWFEVRLGD